MDSDLHQFFTGPIGLTFATVTYLIAAFYFMQFYKARRERQKKELFEAVTRGLETGVLATLNDVVNLYQGIFRIRSEEVAHGPGLSMFLRDYFSRLVSGKTGPDSPDKLVEWKEQVTEWLKKHESSTPFAELPDVERHLIDDISAFLASGDTTAIKRKLDQAGKLDHR